MPTHALILPNAPQEVAVYQLKTIITDSPIKALPTTPITLVAAPGAGKYLVFHGALWNAKFSGGFYTNIEDYDGIDIVNSISQIAVDGGFWDDASASVGRLSELLTSPTVVYREIPIPDSVPGYVLPIFLAQPANSANGALLLTGHTERSSNKDWTGGHVDNTLEITVFYSIVDL